MRYQQVHLEPKSQELVTINTLKDLFQFNSIQFGVSVSVACQACIVSARNGQLPG